MSTKEIRFVSQSVHSITKLTITIICDVRQSDDHPRGCHSDSCCDCGQTDDSDFMVGRVTAAAASCRTVRRTPRVRGRTASTRRVDVEVTGWCRAIRIATRGGGTQRDHSFGISKERCSAYMRACECIGNDRGAVCIVKTDSRHPANERVRVTACTNDRYNQETHGGGSCLFVASGRSLVHLECPGTLPFLSRVPCCTWTALIHEVRL